jgi:hypothetical protein
MPIFEVNHNEINNSQKNDVTDLLILVPNQKFPTFSQNQQNTLYLPFH